MRLLKENPWNVVNLPLRAGMSVGLFLISLELVMMVIILLFVPRQIVGYCFLGFAIGESLGASALRIAGGIFTKIADIGSDLMKIVFKVKEDDPRNPGVIADCTGDNAGDSVGPTADGFETYGVTGVALISFITLAITIPDITGRIDIAKILAGVGVATVSKEAIEAIAKVFQAELQSKLIVWIFAMRFLMDFFSGISYFINQAISTVLYKNKTEFDFEAPLMRLIWIAAILCISTSFFMSYMLLGNLDLAMTVDQLKAAGVDGVKENRSVRFLCRHVVETGDDHQLRNPRGRSHPRVHQDIHQLQVQARQRNRHCDPRRRTVPDNPLRYRCR